MPGSTPLVFSLVALVLLAVVLLVRRWIPGPGDSPRGLDRATMEQALVRLGELAAAEGHTLTLIVVGGAAMVLNYQSRYATQDVDAFFVTPPEARQTRAWAKTVATELRLPADWLNDGAKGFMQGVSYGPLLIDAPGIKVYQISPEQLLAMKLSAWRSAQDISDATTVLADLVRYYPNKPTLWHAVAPYTVHLKAQYAFEELWERTYGDTDTPIDSD
ncbi:MAG: hypothetical protein HC822_02715 [Oscillochloris sp.]|nr:hypothetical protein [Oscillochloris sp.]